MATKSTKAPQTETEPELVTPLVDADVESTYDPDTEWL